MKIIQLITELYPAGAEKVLLNLSRELKRKGHQVTVISLQPLPATQTDIVDDLLAENIPVQSLNITKITPWRILKLTRLLKQQIGESTNQQAILHSHLIHANIVSRIISLFINRKQIKIINTIHIAEKRKSKWWHFSLDKLTFKLCDTQTAVSSAAQQFHAEKIGVSFQDIPVILNGIVPPKVLTESKIQSLKKEWQLEDCSKIIGSIGRLDWQKGYDIILKRLPELSEQIPGNESFGIVIIGEGPQRTELEKIISDNQFKNIKVVLPGYRKDAADCIAAFDLFIMPSRYEGFGLTLIEAMAHGVPCLCSNADSLPELIQDYNNGKSADFNSKTVIIDIMEYLNNKKQKPYIPYSTEYMANGYLKIYLD